MSLFGLRIINVLTSYFPSIHDQLFLGALFVDIQNEVLIVLHLILIAIGETQWLVNLSNCAVLKNIEKRWACSLLVWTECLLYILLTNWSSEEFTYNSLMPIRNTRTKKYPPKLFKVFSWTAFDELVFWWVPELCRWRSSRIPGKDSSVATGSKAVVDGYFHLAIALAGKRSQKYFLENVSVYMSESIDLLVTLE